MYKAVTIITRTSTSSDAIRGCMGLQRALQCPQEFRRSIKNYNSFLFPKDGQVCVPLQISVSRWLICKKLSGLEKIVDLHAQIFY